MIDGAKTFSTNRPSDREFIGGWVTAWLQRQPDVEVVRTYVLQSSTHSNHCLTIVVLYKKKTPAMPATP